MRQRLFLKAAAGLVALAAAGPAAAQPAAPPLQAHRAVYNLNLVRSGASADMVSAKGRLVYDIKGSACAGYSVGSRFVTRVVDREGMARTTDMRASSVETMEPPSFSFRNEEYVDEGLVSVVRGAAEGRADGVSVTLEEPKTSTIMLPRAVFPAAHTKLVIEAARNGDKVIEAPIYDGGESADKMYQTTVVIGPAETGLPRATADERAALSAVAGADSLASRRYVISYFDPAAGGEATPRYVLTFEMLDNGISYAATFDYGDFVLSGSLAELDLVAEAPCPSAP